VRTSILSFALLGLTTAGCLHEGDFGPEEPDTADPPQAAVQERNVEVQYGGEDDTADVVTQAPEPPPQSKRREPVPFHLGAGYGALGQVDLHSCRDQGLQAGYLRMHVTFRDDGRIVRVAVEAGDAPPDEALACIGQQLKMAMVPAFDGDDVSLSKSFFVN
jgi:hypothetical protein